MIRLLLTSLSSTHQHQPLEWHGRPTSGMVRFCSRPPTMRKDITFMELKLTWMSDNETKKTPDPNRRVRLTYLLGYALRTYIFQVWLPDLRSQPHRTQWNSQQSDNITDTMKVKIYSSKIRRGNISIIAYVLNTYNIYNTMSINLCWAHRDDTTRSSREEEDATSTKEDVGCTCKALSKEPRAPPIQWKADTQFVKLSCSCSNGLYQGINQQQVHAIQAQQQQQLCLSPITTRKTTMKARNFLLERRTGLASFNIHIPYTYLPHCQVYSCSLLMLKARTWTNDLS